MVVYILSLLFISFWFEKLVFHGWVIYMVISEKKSSDFANVILETSAKSQIKYTCWMLITDIKEQFSLKLTQHDILI